MHSRCFGRPAVFPQKPGHYFYEPLVSGRDFQQSLHVARVDFFWGALDDEEFFVVEGSGGWRCRLESATNFSQRLLHRHHSCGHTHC